MKKATIGVLKVKEMKKNIIGYTQGAFDMFHVGHLNLIRNAKKQCDYLTVGVNSDELIETYKKKRAVVPVAERIEIIRAIKYVDEVILVNDLDKLKIWNDIHFNAVFIGDDWKGSNRWNATERSLAELGAKVIYLPYTTGTTSTLLREKLL